MRFTPLVVETPPDTAYHGNPRMEIVHVARMLGVSGRIIDAGCGFGALGSVLLDEGLASHVIGVELDAQAFGEASRRLGDRGAVVQRDLGDPALYDDLPDDFDCLIAADVLEHLSDPLTTLRRLSGLIRPGGRWVISVPNVRNYRVVADLVLRDRWEYVDQGICDRTHLRFFTSSSAVQLCRDAGLTPDAGFWLVAGRSAAIARLVRPLGSFAAVQVVVSGRIPG